MEFVHHDLEAWTMVAWDGTTLAVFAWVVYCIIDTLLELGKSRSLQSFLPLTTI